MFDLPRISEYFSFLANHPLASAILRLGGARFVILSREKVYQDKLGMVEGLRASSLTSTKGYPLQHASFNP